MYMNITIKGEYIVSKFIFTGGLLINGYRRSNQKTLLVVIEDRKIKYAGPITDTKFDSGEVIDITGKTIMPGLIDAHLHFSGNLSDNDTEWVLEPVIQNHSCCSTS